MCQIADQEILVDGFHPEFDIEAHFDHRTMHCGADIMEMTGWNSDRIEEQVRLGNFPEPMNGNFRLPVWSRALVDAHYWSMIAYPPTAAEMQKIEKHQEIYDQTYREALAEERRNPSALWIIKKQEAEARSQADRRLFQVSRDDDEDGAEIWQELYEDALSGKSDIDDLSEMVAIWKARQAVRWK
jgi:hypothetical protein